MKKVLLIGPGGSGKSTLAKRISETVGLPLIHLDAIFWRPGWKETPKAEWQNTVDQLIQADAWVMDGNYGGTLEARLTACDTVVLLDMPPLLCLCRVLGRRLRFHGRSRPNMAAGCPERFSLDFAWWIATYRWRRLPKILRRLAVAAEQGKQVVVLRSSAAVDDFVANLKGPPGNAFKPGLLRGAD